MTETELKENRQLYKLTYKIADENSKVKLIAVDDRELRLPL